MPSDGDVTDTPRTSPLANVRLTCGNAPTVATTVAAMADPSANAAPPMRFRTR
jgi:hypothetical protein